MPMHMRVELKKYLWDNYEIKKKKNIRVCSK